MYNVQDYKVLCDYAVYSYVVRPYMAASLH
jgi:hypothetical protein